MRKTQWISGLLMIAVCAVLVALQPTEVQAASQSDQSAYRAVFNASYYYNAYPDVAAVCGKSESALFNHFVNFGVKEGRSGNAEFNVQAYRERYSDLQQAFGSNLAAYCRHYISFGKAEGRSAVKEGQAPVTIATIVPTELPNSTSASEESETPGEPEGADATVTSGTVIGTCTTKYVENESRANNVRLAAQRINNVVVQPGQSFSFSKTILARTTANGYVEGPIFVSGKKSTGIGGGVCQVSSTLYAAMVYAKLPATERHPHSLPVDYLPAGLDATIAGNYMDLKFVNIFSQPLLIQASAQNGVLTVSLVLQ